MASDEVTLRADGRWGGKVTSRPLPHSDPYIELLSAEDRALLAEVWLGRAASERRVADSFVFVGDALRELRAGEVLIGLADRAVDDEMRHTELSQFVASRFAGESLEPPPRLDLVVPSHKGATQQVRHVLHVVGQCALNETIASAFLEVALAHTRAPTASIALRELLSDEIDHARIGWALLASVDDAMRNEVGKWLPKMAIANLRMWRDAPRRYPDDPRLAAHGAPSSTVVEEALQMALRDLIVPGFEEVGISTTETRAWLERGAPT